MTCCDNNCGKGRYCPERIERLREAKRLLDEGNEITPERWIVIGVAVCAVSLLAWIGSLICEALA